MPELHVRWRRFDIIGLPRALAVDAPGFLLNGCRDRRALGFATAPTKESITRVPL